MKKSLEQIMKYNAGLKELEILVHDYLCALYRHLVHACTTEKHEPCNTFFKFLASYHVPLMSLRYLQNMPLEYPYL